MRTFALLCWMPLVLQLPVGCGMIKGIMLHISCTTHQPQCEQCAVLYSIRLGIYHNVSGCIGPLQWVFQVWNPRKYLSSPDSSPSAGEGLKEKLLFTMTCVQNFRWKYLDTEQAIVSSVDRGGGGGGGGTTSALVLYGSKSASVSLTHFLNLSAIHQFSTPTETERGKWG